MRNTSKTSKIKLKTLYIRLDYLAGPIWKDVYDASQNKIVTGIAVVDNDAEVKELDSKIGQMYSSYYSFEGDKSPDFNEAQERKDKECILGLLKKLNDRLAEINDGSFVVKDEETARIGKL